MKKYAKVDVSEQQLEDLIRRNPELIEEGLAYVDHQKQASNGRLDVLLIDSGNALVVAELKVAEDDGMLLQAVDYYDYVTTNIERYARIYSKHGIDPTQAVRLFLIAPSFSQALVNRAKWLDLPLAMFTYSCIRIEGDNETVAVFNERERETAVQPQADQVYTFDDHLNYITDLAVRDQVRHLIEDISKWTMGSVSVDPIKHSLSFKVNGRWFTYLDPRRKHFLLSTRDAEENWKVFPIKGEDDLTQALSVVRAAAERYA